MKTTLLLLSCTLGAGLKLERRAERRSVPGKLWTAADERALRKTGGGKSGTTSDGGSSAKNGKSYEPIPGVSFSKGKGKSGGKSKGGYKLDFCRNCNFSVIYDELAAVQVVNGLVVNFDQIKGTKEIGICDTCKCSSTDVGKMVASYQGECDQTEGVDILELVISAPDSGSIEIGCPDMSYDISAECRTFNLDNDEEELFQIDPITNEPLVGVPLITLEEQFGPIVVFEIDSGTTAYCRATCIEVGLP